MDTTGKKAAIQAGEAQYNSSSTGLSKMIIAIPLSQRSELASLAEANGTSQQELIRFAISALLEHPATFAPAPKPAKTKPEPKPAKRQPEPIQPELTLQEQLDIAIAREDYDEAARLRDAIARTQRPPQPGPEYTWVNRGSSGYWRRGKRTSE